eukprot:gnl/Trimastix_PCT/1111.p1 GENE.gnl/Trimastix_PCT/1111~~gnl/Trimastix_PCT/1111.p1  ORF type:complete len:635 (+),score=42.31 gnl/Trimastix_PCT/1111:443-2347(+)
MKRRVLDLLCILLFVSLVNASEEDAFWTRDYGGETIFLMGDSDAANEDLALHGELITYNEYTHPKSFDWRSSPCCHPIRNQGSCGSCWSFSSSEVISDRFCLASNGSQDVILSPQYLIDCYASHGCSGASTSGAFSWVQSNGCVPEACYPYQAAEKTCPSTCTRSDVPALSSDKHYITEYKYTRNVEDAMEELYRNGPLSLSITVYQNFHDYAGGIYNHYAGINKGGHAMKIVGYGEENGVKYWIIANSWGETWGEKGFCRFLRGENLCGVENYLRSAKPVLRSTPFTVTSPAHMAAQQSTETMNIRWTSNTAGITQVCIALHRQGEPTEAHPIETQTNNTGHYNWSPTSDSTLSEGFYRVAITPVGQLYNYSFGPLFRYVKTAENVTFTAPTHNWYYLRAHSQIITWTTTGLPMHDMKLELIQPGNPLATAFTPQVIAEKTNANTKLAYWTPSGSLSDGTYQIRATLGSRHVHSEPFLIARTSPINVTQPAHGTSYQPGNTVQIRWTMPAAFDWYFVTLGLFNATSNLKLRWIFYTHNDGACSFSLKSDEVTGTYFIRAYCRPKTGGTEYQLYGDSGVFCVGMDVCSPPVPEITPTPTPTPSATGNTTEPQATPTPEPSQGVMLQPNQLLLWL